MPTHVKQEGGQSSGKRFKPREGKDKVISSAAYSWTALWIGGPFVVIPLYSVVRFKILGPLH
jgi:hypothetical protein